MMGDELERVIRPIVEGQIRGFLKEHPGIVEAVDWYKPRRDKTTTFVGSLSKRIVRDLVCPTSRARLAAALSGLPTGALSGSTVEREAVSAGCTPAVAHCGEAGSSGARTGRAGEPRRPLGTEVVAGVEWHVYFNNRFIAAEKCEADGANHIWDFHGVPGNFEIRRVGAP